MVPLNTKRDITTEVRWAFVYFFIVVCLGIFMRSVSVVDYPFDFTYRYILHTHSHLAILGFIYTLLSALLVHTFVPFTDENEKKYRKLFYVTQFSVLGMLFSFPFQGYGAVSISFSSLFVICSYYFARFYLKNSQKNPFVQAAIFYLILSSIGIWLIPVTIVKYGKLSDVYMCSIAFFLHFQYNGWMLSSLMGLLLERYDWARKYPKLVKRIFIAFQAGVIGTLFISWVGYFGYSIYYLISGLSAVLWLLALIAVAYLYSKERQKKYLTTLFIGFFIFKVLVMGIAAIPFLTELFFTNIDLVISYLHFNFLGVITIGLLLFLSEAFTVKKIWIYCFLVAFFLTEALITYKGGSILFHYPLVAHFQEYLLVATVLFILPAIGWLVTMKKKGNGKVI
jgi:membrane protein